MLVVLQVEIGMLHDDIEILGLACLVNECFQRQVSEISRTICCFHWSEKLHPAEEQEIP